MNAFIFHWCTGSMIVSDVCVCVRDGKGCFEVFTRLDYKNVFTPTWFSLAQLDLG